MRSHGRYLRFRHVFPELFGPGVQARRGLLRFRWMLLQRLDFRPIWSLAAACGLGGILLTISLFFQPYRLTTAAITQPAPAPASPPLAPQNFAPLQTSLPVTPPTPTLDGGPRPYVQAAYSWLTMVGRWDDRRVHTVASSPVSVDKSSLFGLTIDPRWVRAVIRRTEFPGGLQSTFTPYREPPALRDWSPITPLVSVSDQPGRSARIETYSRPTARIEKRAPESALPGRPLKYEIVVSNVGSQPLPDVTVFESVDVTRVVAVEPPALLEPTGLHWKLGGLAAGETRQLQVTVWTAGATSVSTSTDVELADRISTVVRVEGEVVEPFYQREPTPSSFPAPLPKEADLPAFPRTDELPPFPQLEDVPARTPTPPPAAPQPPPVAPPPVQNLPAFPDLPPFPDVPAFPQTDASPAPAPMPQPPTQPVPVQRAILKVTTQSPEAVAVGSDASTWYEIENTGDAPATNVELIVTLPEGLLHFDGASQVRHTISRIEPGEKRRAQLITRVRAHGSYVLEGELTSGGLRETARVDFLAPERPALAGDAENSDERPHGAVVPCQCTLPQPPVGT